LEKFHECYLLDFGKLLVCIGSKQFGFFWYFETARQNSAGPGVISLHFSESMITLLQKLPFFGQKFSQEYKNLAKMDKILTKLNLDRTTLYVIVLTLSLRGQQIFAARPSR